MACNIRKNQPAVVLSVQWQDCFGTIINIAAAAVLTLKFQRPDLTTFSVVANMPSGGVDGIEAYTSILTTFDQAGNWKREWYTNITGWSEIIQFTVEDILP
jgi:hypothetical protein